MTASKIRGDYRTLNASWWDDPDVQDELSPHARLLFANLRTCHAYGLAGIFRYYLDTVRRQTGLVDAHGVSAGQVLLLFDALEQTGYIAHDAERSVVWIVDGLTNDPHISLRHPRQRSGVLSQLRALPRTRLLLPYLSHYELLGAEALEDLETRARQNATAATKPETQLPLMPLHRCDSADTGRARPSHTLIPTLNPSPIQSRRAPAPPAEPAPPSREDQDQARLEESERLLAQFVESAEAWEPGAGRAATLYFSEAEEGLREYYAGRGGRWTPTRRLALLKRLLRYRVEATLAGLEIYADRRAGRFNEAYLAGIAKDLNHELERNGDEGRKAFDRELAANRRRGTGVYSRLEEDRHDRQA